MIEILQETRGNILAIKATEKLTVDDYEKVFIPKLDEILGEHEKIRILMYLDENFHGWEMGAAWDDAKFGTKHWKDCEKIAVVGGPKWVEWSTRIFALLMKGDTKTFDAYKLQDAIKWIAE